MKNRLEVGCLAMVLTRPEDSTIEGSYFTGACGTVVEGPYPDTLSEACWSIQGPEVLRRCLEAPVQCPSDILSSIPGSRLIRIDDLDVGLDEAIDRPETSPAGA